jgi:uncharacterized membrane protein YtjA (UPF0391 family)
LPPDRDATSCKLQPPGRGSGTRNSTRPGRWLGLRRFTGTAVKPLNLHRLCAASGASGSARGWPRQGPEQGLARLLLSMGRPKAGPTHPQETAIMLSLAITFLVIALIAAVLGFGGIAGTASGIAKVLFLIFIVLFLVSLIFGGVRRPRV